MLVYAHRFGESIVLDVGTWRCVFDLPDAETLGRRLVELCTDAEHDTADRELAVLASGRNTSKPPREPGMAAGCACKCGPQAPAWQHGKRCPRAMRPPASPPNP